MEDNKLVPQTVYIIMDVKNNLPAKKSVCYRGKEKLFFEWEGKDVIDLKATHWLEKKENQIVISIDEFKEQLKSAYNAGRTREYENKFGYDAYVRSTPTTKPDLDTYIDNLLCKKNNSK